MSSGNRAVAATSGSRRAGARGPRDLLLACALTVALAACGQSKPDVPSDSIANGPDPATYRYSCTGAPGFLPALFDQPATAELEDHPSATALRAFLGDDAFGLGFLPDSGWWLVSRSDTEAQYIARIPGSVESPFGYVTMQSTGASWGFSGGGDCLPEIMVDGRVPAIWTLPPDRPFPDPSTVEFTALVTDRICTGGEPVGERLFPPVLTFTATSVFIVFSARPYWGVTTCQGKPSTEVTVRMREPLGDRKLLDAGVFPPTDPR